MFLMRGTEWDGGLSPREIQDGLQTMMAWIEGLRQKGLLRDGQPLMPEGRIVTGSRTSVTDGPFVEAKEAVGGYLLVNAPTLEEAVALAKECPTLKYGLFIEVRPVLVACPITDRVEAQLASQAN